MQLHLHVGHGKTGSSFLQSWWAVNRPTLLQAQLLYPEAPGDARARAGAFSMGNGSALDQALSSCSGPRAWRRWWRGLQPHQPLEDVLFSAERWTRHLPEQCDGLLALADACGIERIRLWLLVRDPLDHAMSVYGQMVKRHGFTGDLDAWLEIYDFPEALLRFLETFQARPDRFMLQIDHYGRQVGGLLERMQAWLALPGDLPWQKPAQCVVNRSLTADELLLMRWLNGRLGDRAAVVGEQLVDRLPQLAPARLQPSAQACAQFVAHWRPLVDEINHRLPRDVQLQFPAPAAPVNRPQEPTAIQLLPEQLDCLLDGTAPLLVSSRPGLRQRLKHWLTPTRTR